MGLWRAFTGPALSKEEAERGSILITTALLLVVMIGFAALAVDIGFFSHTRRDAQNDADAMALAGVRELATRGLTPAQRQANATDVAEDWATKNDVTVSEIVSITYNATCSGDPKPDIITVRLARPQNTFLASVIGISSATINVCATARTGMAKGGPGLLPIGVLYNDPDVPGNVCWVYDDEGSSFNSNFYYNPNDGADLSYAEGGVDELCVVKIPRPGAGEAWANGNSGPLRLDEEEHAADDNLFPDCDDGNSGAAEYGENIVEESVCAYGRGDEVGPLPGAQTGQTCDNFDTRLANHLQSDAAHAGHDIEDVFTDTSTPPDAIYEIVDVTNPHFGILPVITTQGSGASQTVEILTFVTVYVVGCTTTGNGNNALYTVSVIPVNSQYFTPGQEIVEPGEGGYLTDWPAYTIKLIN